MASTEAPTRATNLPADTSTELIRLSVNITAETREALEKLAAAKSVTMTEALRRAIMQAAYLQEKTANGSLILEESNGKLRELVFL